jgi:acyl transferase domain-containing protein/NADPH:quinone reductase-like Zn-dependent oxidoreductase/acyl carrier protein
VKNKKRVAIVGYSFRLPGTARDRFWADLLAGKSLVTRVPADRWAQETYFHPRRSEPGTSYTFAAGTLGDVSLFDAAFFGISPREAEQMDPQQRVLLELAWEALEDAGIPPSSLRGRRWGVYIGLSSTDYSYRWIDDPAGLDATSISGNTASIAANRISYCLDLRGPSMAIDTACSSSLFAFHQAWQSICSGESTAALVGAVGLMLHPSAFIGFSKASMLSPRGICNVFDEAADGYVRSEGGGVFVLKDLDAALADGDRVLAVVAGSGVNADGRTTGLTVPSADAQTELLREVYARARIAPSAVDYVEAHGTGTAVGDPVETFAIGQALGRRRRKGAPLLIGSVKGNVGHLEAASGVAGLVKALLCLQHRKVPPTTHVRKLNPRIRSDEWNLRVLTEAVPLHPSRDLVIGVNSFGFGGANAHVVLQSPPQAGAVGPAVPGTEIATPLFLSARSDVALRALARAYAAHLRSHPDQALYDIAYAAAFRRDWHEHRLCIECGSHAAAAEKLSAFASGAQVPDVSTAVALGKPSAPAFVYSGNGSQWAGMGRVLLSEEAVFRDALRAVDRSFAQHGDFSIVAELESSNADRLELTEVAQPALFAVQVGITELLRHWGVEPAAVVGHSVGEVAAAWACGALTLDQAVQVVRERSRQQSTRKGQGAMTAVSLPEPEVLDLLASLGLDDEIGVAAVNSPRAVTLAGGHGALKRIEAALIQKNVFHRRLDVDYPFHSAAMDPIRAGLEAGLADLRSAAAQRPFYSTVTGSRFAGEELGAGYWWRNVREPVRFAEAIRSLIDDQATVFVEIGPHAILRNHVADSLRSAAVPGRSLATMLRTSNDRSALRRAFHEIVLTGAPVQKAKTFPQRGAWIDLPSYAWQRESFWRGRTPEGPNLVDRRKEHPLLGYRLHDGALHWENHLDAALYPTYRDHVVGDVTVFPAAGFVEMALGASALIHGGEGHELEELEIRVPLVLDEAHSKTVRLGVDRADGTFSISSRPRLSKEPWTVHAVGRLLGAPAVVDACKPRVPRRGADVVGATHYALAADVGLRYGPAFQAVSRVWVDADTAVARLVTPKVVAAEIPGTVLHPSYLDAGFQLLIDLLREEVTSQVGAAFVPVRVGRVRLHRMHASVAAARTRLKRRSPRSLVADFELYDSQGAIVAVAEDVRFRAAVLRRAPKDAIRYLAYRSVPRPRGPDQLRAALPPTAELVAACVARLHFPEDNRLRQRYHREVEPLLDVLCAGFAERAMRALAGDRVPIESESLIARGVVPAAQRPLLDRLTEILREDAILEPGEGGWRWNPLAELPDAGESWRTLIGDYPDEAVRLIPIGSVGMRLADILAGRESARVAVVSGELGQTYARLFAGTPLLADVGRALADATRLALEKLPAGRRLRLLELTPARSELAPRISRALDSSRCDFVVGCTSRIALDENEELLDRAAGIDARLLRIDAPEGDQDAAELGVFDIVIVGDGLSCAHDADAALARAAHLVADDGALILLVQPPSRWMDLVLGVDPAWWTGTPPGPRSPLRTPAEWSALLERHGFSAPEVLPELPGLESGAYLMIARRAARRSGAAAATADPGTWVFVQEQSGYSATLGAAVQAELRALGQRVVEVLPGPERLLDVDFVSALGAVGETHGQITGIVNLLGLSWKDTARRPEAMLDWQVARGMPVAGMLQACSMLGIKPACWLVTARATASLVPGAAADPGAGNDDVADALLWGFGRTAANEHPDLRLRLVDCAEPDKLERMVAGLAGELLQPDGEDEIVLTEAGRHALRLASLPPPATAGVPGHPRDIVRLDFATPGPLKNLVWRRDRLRVPGAGEIEIDVRAAGLNFRDVMYAMGLLSDEVVENGFAGAAMGMDVSGVVTAIGPGVTEVAPGDEVVALAPAGFATRVVTSAGAVAAKPAEWSFGAGATVPTAFLTVYYALHHLARLQEGERVLIHGAAGGVGIAAIQLAKLAGAEVFATAGSPEKRDFVRLLGADHALDSRSLAFADRILELTGGEGVDVVLNSLAGEAMVRSLRVLRPFGRFLELGKRDFYGNTYVGLRPFRNNITYFGIDADQLMHERPKVARQLFGELMELFARGALKPLPYRAFPADQAIDAFRYMQQSRQIGKIVLGFQDPIARVQPGPAKKATLALPADATYLVTGGLSGFGLSTARWLVSKGARHLVLVGRRGIATPGAREAVAGLEAAGARVRAVACDITDRSALSALLAEIGRAMPPLRGIVHAAMVIDDGLIRSLTADRLRSVLAPKVLGACHLDELTRHLALDFFVLYSSATTLFGNPGQANYVAANAYLEALAGARRAAGRPALCVGWGPIADVGYLARDGQVKEMLESRMGGSALVAETALAVLEDLLVAGGPDCGVLDFDWSRLRRLLPTAQSPRFSLLAQESEDSAAGVDAADLRRWLEELQPEELKAALTELVCKEVGQILRLPPERLDARGSLHELGMDSLMGVELITAVEARFGIHVPVVALSEAPTIERLVDRLIQQLQSPPAAADEAAAQQALAAQLAAQHAGQQDGSIETEVAELLVDENIPVPGARK